MVLSMFGPLLILAASVSPLAGTSPPAAGRGSSFQAISRVSARATASVQIISGVRFGAQWRGEASGAIRRQSQLADGDGALRRAELLEFQ
jgi:hypothetical protein